MTATDDLYPLPELCDEPEPERLRHGTWKSGRAYYTGNRQENAFVNLLNDERREIPPEHIASPSCQSLQGINENALTIAQMKNCRNVRYLVPKPKDWKAQGDDRLLEESSLFYVSGESNGSNLAAGHFMP